MPAGRDGGASIEIRNRGKTPAKDVSVLWATFVADADTTNENIDETDKLVSNPSTSEMLLGPGEHRAANVEVKTFDPEEIAAVRERRAYLWVVGRVEYFDAFDRHRFTRFCHRYQGPDLGPDAGTYGHYGNSYT